MYINVLTVVENVTVNHIFRVWLKGRLLDANGREFEEMDNYESLPAGSTAVLESCPCNVKPKRLSGASISFEAPVDAQVAVGQVAASQITLDSDD